MAGVPVQNAVIIEAELYHSIAVLFNSPNRDAAFRPLDRAAVLADMEGHYPTPSSQIPVKQPLRQSYPTLVETFVYFSWYGRTAFYPNLHIRSTLLLCVLCVKFLNALKNLTQAREGCKEIKKTWTHTTFICILLPYVVRHNVSYSKRQRCQKVFLKFSGTNQQNPMIRQTKSTLYMSHAGVGQTAVVPGRRNRSGYSPAATHTRYRSCFCLLFDLM